MKYKEQPVCITDGGIKEWYLNNGDLHREDGPARVYPNECEEWWLNGKRHREDGPAVTDPKRKYRAWYLDGKLHREDGPAEVYSNGQEMWWLDGKQIESNDYYSIEFKTRWKQLVDLYHMKVIMEA